MENTKLVSGEIQHSSSKTRKCERLGLTNAKGPNQEIQISAGTNPISSKANQSKLCEGSRSVICHMLHVTCIYWIITLTEKMMVHNHFDDQIMSKSSIRSTFWPNCQVAHKIVKWSIKWSIDFDMPLMRWYPMLISMFPDTWALPTWPCVPEFASLGTKQRLIQGDIFLWCLFSLGLLTLSLVAHCPR